MSDAKNDGIPEILPPSANSGLTFEIQPRSFPVYYISDSELESLGAGSNSVSTSFFTLTIGILFSFAGIYLTLPPNSIDSGARATIVAIIISSLILAVFFGVLAARDWQRNKSAIDRIKKRRIP